MVNRLENVSLWMRRGMCGCIFLIAPTSYYQPKFVILAEQEDEHDYNSLNAVVYSSSKYYNAICIKLILAFH